MLSFLVTALVLLAEDRRIAVVEEGPVLPKWVDVEEETKMTECLNLALAAV